MDMTNQSNNIKALCVTIAPRRIGHQPSTLNPQLLFVVTLTTHKDVRSYPCRSMESAIKLAERFIAGVIKPRPAAQEPSTLNPQPSTAPVAS